jgi:hypothetical protein
MRVFRLAALIAEAEGLRLKAALHRIMGRAVFAVIALIFLLGALAMGQAALYVILAGHMSPAAALGCLAGADLLVALILAAKAASKSPSSDEVAALTLRRNAAEELVRTLTWQQIISTAFNFARNRKRDK